MKELKVIRGNNSLVFEGITNMQELKKFAQEKSKEYENIIVTSDNYKQCEETIKEIKPYRTEVKKYRAAVNKDLKSKTSDILSEIDSVTNIFSEVIDPVSEKVAEYKEKVKQEKIQKKKDFICPQIEELNADLETIYKNIPFSEYEPIQFLESWGSKKQSDIVDELNKIVDEKKAVINAKLDRIDNAKTQAEMLKLKLDLKTDVNYMQMKERIYDDNWKEQLEELAFSQQEIEVDAVLKEQEEARIKRELKEKKEKEELEKKLKEQEEARIKEVKKQEEANIENKHIDIRLYLNDQQNKEFEKFIKENKIKFEMI